MGHAKLCLCDDKLSGLAKRYLYTRAGGGPARAILASFALARVQGSHMSGHAASITVGKALGDSLIERARNLAVTTK